MWKNILMATIDKHAPLRSRRTRKRKSPWITNELKRRIYNRDYLKKKAISSNDPHVWQDYKQARFQIKLLPKLRNLSEIISQKILTSIKII
jgi:hypothetical protein